MAVLVADTSGLVSLGMAASRDPDPLRLCLETYDVSTATPVVDELRDIASHADHHADAAREVIDRMDQLEVRSVDLDPTLPLGVGENAAVTLANERSASLFLCDECNQLGLIHASLAGPRLVTTPTLLAVFVRSARLSPEEARDLLEVIAEGRSWHGNSYVERARELLAGPDDDARSVK